ncbi:MAG: hypothetical protein HYU29_03560 [Chloroflexi bacterium]|nr:hypothetical protein [Chloroflexota bacterium]
MGLDIGIINITYLPRPQGLAYRFAWEMATEASTSGYMHGEGNNWAPFSQRKVLLMLDDFASRRSLPAPQKAEVLAWVRSLPWEDWRDNVDPLLSVDDDDHDPILDHDPDIDGGLIELHFNW